MQAWFQLPGATRASSQQLSPASSSSHSASSKCTARGLPSQRTAATAAALPEHALAADTAVTAAAGHEVDPETLRLMTAATILSASESGSDDEAAATSFLDGEDGSLPAGSPSPLSVVDELQVLDADSLSLVVGILRQHQTLGADGEADVQLSERLRDLLLLLRQRSSSSVAANAAASKASSSSSSSILGLQRSASPTSVLDGGAAAAGAAADDGFWAGPDEWADVRSALMGIGINASIDEEDEEDVWVMEEEGPARRTRLLKSLPRLDAETSAELAAFLSGVQQRTGGVAPASSGAAAPSSGSGNGKTAAADLQQYGVEDSQDERWWDEVTQAYQKLWQQARLQQAK